MLEILVSILYFINKVFLLFNEKAGWIIGIVASGTAAIYFLGIELYIFCALEIACFCIMIYGSLGQRDSKKVAIAIYGICLLVTAFLLIKVPDSGILEFITSLLFMIAFVSLAENKRRTGWIAMGIAHAIMFFITFEKDQFIFASLQAASVLVCLIGSLYPKLTTRSLNLTKAG